MTKDAAGRALATIAKCDDPKKLRQIAENAKRQGLEVVRRAAEFRLYDVLPAARRGTPEFDVWRSIYALEGSLSARRHAVAQAFVA